MSAAIPFGRLRVGPAERVVVVAEIGVNHEGDVAACARMIDAAGAAGADAVKLQTMDADECYVSGTESHALFSGCALSRDETAQMFALARRRGMECFTTVGDFASLEWVEGLAPAAHKISSGLLTHLPLVRRAAATGRTLVMSTGMAETAEIDEAVAAAREAGASAIGLLQCTSLYPTPPHALNLANVGWLARRYGVPVGFSDHSEGSEAAMLAVAAGAAMIEKHFTLDRGRPGYDHGISLEPSDFAAMVAAVRRAETMRGRAGSPPTDAEREAARRNYRCLVARRPIVAGGVFTAENLALKRPLPDRRGLAPKHYDAVLGKRSKHDLATDDPVMPDAVEGLS